MSTTATATRPTPPPTRPRAAWRQLLARQAVFALAVGQLVAAALLGPGDGQPGGGGADLLITPAGWTFGIWGVVIAGCLAYGAYQLSSRRGDLPALQAVARPLITAQVGFLTWLVVAELAPAWATALVLAGMVAALALAYTRALAGRRAIPLLGRLLLLNTLGVFTAWSIAALPINVASALAAAGLPASGAGANAWQLVVLAVVVALGVAVVLRWRARLASTATVLWALVGVAAGAAGRDATLLAGLAGAAALGFAAWALWWRWNDVRRKVEEAVRTMAGAGPGGTRGDVVPGVVVMTPNGPAAVRRAFAPAPSDAPRPGRGARR